MPPGVLAGDLIVGWAVKGGTPAPGAPAGFTSLHDGGVIFTSAGRLAYRYATVDGEGSGTWSSSSATYISVYRNAVVGPTGFSSNGNSWPAVAGISVDAWVFRAVYGKSSTLNPPSGFATRNNNTSGSARAVTADTDGPYGSTSIAAETISPSASTVVASLAIEPA